MYTTNPRRQMAGFSLIELLVALGVGILALLAVTTALVNADQQRRVTVSGGDAQSTGILSSYLVERDIRMAGFGMSGLAALSCNTLTYNDSTVTTGAQTISNFGPFRITAGANANTPDTLTIRYSTSSQRPAGAALTSTYTAPGTTVAVANRTGFCAGDVVLIAQQGNATCTLGQLSASPATGAGNMTLAAGNTATVSPCLGVARTRYSPAGTQVYATNAQVYNLGQQSVVANSNFLVTNVYTVANNLLTQNGAAIAENVVNFKVQLLGDTTNSGTTAAWTGAQPNSLATWQQVRAIRMAIVVRSPTQEKATVSPASLALWDNAPAAYTMTLSATQQRYRYKVYQTIVPLRNLIWTTNGGIL
ncbi:PilW family protein [Burkholderiaceae bacterium DAT-1]|nr:PilW family protein [Burkholderiaceae bacterium DAT-1]